MWFSTYFVSEAVLTFFITWDYNPEIKVLLIPIIWKLSSEKLIYDLRQDTTKLLEENTGKAFGGITFSNIFLVSQGNRNKINK